MRNESQVRQLIHARIHAGQLPQARNYEVFARKGDELPCVCCDDPITRQHIEHDVEFPSDMGAMTTLPMHAGCYRAWHLVSHAIECGERAVSPGAEQQRPLIGSRCAQSTDTASR